MCLEFGICQRSEYTGGSEYSRVVNMSKVLNSEYASGSEYVRVLDIPRF